MQESSKHPKHFASLVSAYQIGNINVTPPAEPTIIFNQETVDVLGEWNTATGYFTATETGYYKIHASILWGNSVINRVYYLNIYRNAVLIRRNYKATFGAGFQWSQDINAVIYLMVGQTIHLTAFTSNPAGNNIMGSDPATRLSIFRIA